ncbi:MAG: hypothetical protein NVSMB18_11150 [Acetobacteraceae bacterium]
MSRRTVTRPPVPSRGFTLLEILVAVSVLGLMLVLLNQGATFGLRAATTQAAIKDRTGDLEAVDRALRRLVSLADPGIYPEPASLRGTASSLAFTTDLPLPGSGQRQRADVALAVAGGQLRLHWAPHAHVATFAGAPPGDDMVVLDGVERLDLSYSAAGSPSAWASAWNADKLPGLVRIRITFQPGRGRHWPPIVVAPLREPVEE